MAGFNRDNQNRDNGTITEVLGLKLKRNKRDCKTNLSNSLQEDNSTNSWDCFINLTCLFVIDSQRFQLKTK